MIGRFRFNQLWISERINRSRKSGSSQLCFSPRVKEVKEEATHVLNIRSMSLIWFRENSLNSV